MTENELETILCSFERALKSFSRALEQPKNEWVRDSAIQRFEYTFDLAWKVIRRFAKREGLDCNSPLQAFKVALRIGWIEDDNKWLDMRDDRNRTSHTYNESTAEEIFSNLPGYEKKFSGLLESLKRVIGLE